jgi:formylglycine-generating enzyme required for sulfatase activity
MLRSGTIIALLGLAVALSPGATREAPALDMVPVRVSSDTILVARHEVTVAQWQACVDARACADIVPAAKHPETTPATGVNWFDAMAFIAWHNGVTGKSLRLPTLGEWHAINGTQARPAQQPLFNDPRLAWAANYGREETPGGPVRAVGIWSKSRDGVLDLGGNVWEWTASCITDKPVGVDADRCPAMRVAGTHDALLSVFVREPASGGCATGKPPTHIGFRLVEDLN